MKKILEGTGLRFGHKYLGVAKRIERETYSPQTGHFRLVFSGFLG
jgi:hypothetical protein